MSDEQQIRFSGDDGDVSGEALGIGYPEAAIELAEAADELSAYEQPAEDDERRPRVAPLAIAALLGALIGASTSRLL